MWNENWESDYTLAHSAKNSKWGYSNGKRNGNRIAGQKKNVYPGGNHMPNRSDPVYESNMQRKRNQTPSMNLGRNDKPYPNGYKSQALKKKSNALKKQYSNERVIQEKRVSDKTAKFMNDYKSKHKLETKIKDISSKTVSKAKSWLKKFKNSTGSHTKVTIYGTKYDSKTNSLKDVPTQVIEYDHH